MTDIQKRLSDVEMAEIRGRDAAIQRGENGTIFFQSQAEVDRAALLSHISASPERPTQMTEERAREILAQEYERAGYGKQYTDRMVRCIKPDSPNPPPAEIQIALAAMSRLRSIPSMQADAPTPPNPELR